MPRGLDRVQIKAAELQVGDAWRCVDYDDRPTTETVYLITEKDLPSRDGGLSPGRHCLEVWAERQSDGHSGVCWLNPSDDIYVLRPALTALT